MIENRVALLGCGNHLIQNLLNPIHSTVGADIVGVCSRSAKKYQAKATYFDNAPHFISIQEMHEFTRFEKLIVSATPAANLTALEFCRERKIPIFVEKPSLLSPSLFDRPENIDAYVGYNIPHSTIAFRFLQEIGASSLQIANVNIFCAANKPMDPIWNLTSNFESFLFAVGVHAIDLLRRIACPNTETSPHTEVSWADTSRFHSTTILKLKNGPNATVCFTNNSRTFDLRVEVTLVDGTKFSLDGTRGFSISAPKYGGVESKKIYHSSHLGNSSASDGYAYEVKAFLGCSGFDLNRLTTLADDYINLHLINKIIGKALHEQQSTSAKT